MSDAATDPKQQNLAARIDRGLNPPASERMTSPLYHLKSDFIKDLDKHLEVFGGDAAAREAKKAEYLAKFDQEVKRRLTEGAQKGGDPGQFNKRAGEEKKKEAQSMGEAIGGMFDLVVSFFGGMVEGIWAFAKKLPFIGGLLTRGGEWLSDMFSSKSPEVRAKEKLAAGAVDMLGSDDISIDGVVFTLDSRRAKGIYEGIKQWDLTQPVPAAPVEAPPAPPKLPVTVEQEKEKAKQAAEQFGAKLTEGINGGLSVPVGAMLNAATFVTPPKGSDGKAP